MKFNAPANPRLLATSRDNVCLQILYQASKPSMKKTQIFILRLQIKL